MIFEKCHPLLKRSIKKFAEFYDGTSWSADRPHLLTNVWLEPRLVIEGTTLRS